MTITEILNTIHKERVELEIFQALSSWMIEDRSVWIDEAMEQKAIRLLKELKIFVVRMNKIMF